MAHLSARAENIPGLISVGWVMKGTSIDEQEVSLVWLEDAGQKALIDVTGGIGRAAQMPGLTLKMRSYLSGLSEINVYLRRRRTVDEDDVSEDDIENAAILLAFPRVAKDDAARAALKKHLDMLQKMGLISQISFAPNRPEAETAPAPEAQAPAQADPAPAAEAAAPAPQPEPAPQPAPAPQVDAAPQGDTNAAPTSAEAQAQTQDGAPKPPLAVVDNNAPAPAMA